jgi:hypothetical protein
MAKAKQSGLIFLIIEAILFNLMLLCFFFNERLGVIAMILYLFNIVVSFSILVFIGKKGKLAKTRHE